MFNQGRHTRDFTYIDDVVAAILAALANPAKPDAGFDCKAPAEASSSAPWRIYNVGSANPIPLMRYLELIEKCVGRTALIEFLPPQPGDVADTFADVGPLERDLGVRPKITVEEGIASFVRWFREYYRI